MALAVQLNNIFTPCNLHLYATILFNVSQTQMYFPHICYGWLNDILTEHSLVVDMWSYSSIMSFSGCGHVVLLQHCVILWLWTRDLTPVLCHSLAADTWSYSSIVSFSGCGHMVLLQHCVILWLWTRGLTPALCHSHRVGPRILFRLNGATHALNECDQTNCGSEWYRLNGPTGILLREWIHIFTNDD